MQSIFDKFKRKHAANDLTVFQDFANMLKCMNDTDADILEWFWAMFPDAAWTRACGFVVEDLIHDNKFKLLQLFWENDMFRMGGRDRAHRFFEESGIRNISKIMHSSDS